MFGRRCLTQQDHRAVAAVLLALLVLTLEPATLSNTAEPATTWDPDPSAQLQGTDGATYNRVEAAVPPRHERRAEGDIGRDGGVLGVGEHRLIVAAGAVTQATRFSMEVTDDGYLRFDLHAIEETGPGDRGRGQGQGYVRFHGPVFLAVSISGAMNLDGVDAERLVILYEPEDGSAAEPLTTSLAAGGTVAVARLDHFSRYCLAYN